MKNSCVKAKQQGMTMIEIMIALLLGAFLLGGVLQIFAGSNQSYRMQENMSRLQENGRFAMDFITRDIRMADYWGCLRNGLNNVKNNLNPAGVGYDASLHGFDQGIAGTEGAPDANPALDAPDSITLRGAFDSGITVQSPYGPIASAQVQISVDNNLSQGDVVLISDCLQADIFQISNANPDTGGVAVHNTGAVTNPGNCNYDPVICPDGAEKPPNCPGGGNLHCLSKVYEGDASIYRLASISYSIQNGMGGRQALWRQIDADNNELVEGIENLQILYGEDANGDSTADYYVPADAVADMEQVVSIRVNLLAVSADDNLTSQPVAYTYNGATTTPDDRRLRRVFTSTIAVRNRLQ